MASQKYDLGGAYFRDIINANSDVLRLFNIRLTS